MVTLNVMPTIMIVDDTPANLEVLEGILSGQGYQVAAFPRGEMALKSAELNPPDLILLDILMPHMDGFEVCRHLMSNEKLKEIPVIFISALDDIENKMKAFSNGGRDYITKPFRHEEVCARVDTQIKLSMAQKTLKKMNEDLMEIVNQKVMEVSASQLATLEAISSLAEFRDDETGYHIQRSRNICKALAIFIKDQKWYTDEIDESFINDLYFAAPLHDIGKIGIPDHILLKPAKLTVDEFEIMKSHVVIGAKTLERVLEKYPINSIIKMGIELTKYHHERWDGKGYPDGLAGLQIPVSARIMALADVYDALRSKRPYKMAIPHEECVQIIMESANTHFDPLLVKLFVDHADVFEAIYDQMIDIY